MRHVTALLLLALLSLPLIAGILLADTSSDLPACCRRDGQHHCAMTDMPEGLVVKALQAKCPLFPRNVAVPAISGKLVLTNAARLIAPLASPLKIAAPDDTARPIVTHASQNKRGPPANLNRSIQIWL